MKSWTIPLWIISLAVIIVFLIAAKRVLIPMVLAVAIWYLIESLSIGLRSLKFGKRRTRFLPRWITIIIASIIIMGAFLGGIQIIIQNFQGMVRVAAEYEEQFANSLEGLGNILGIEGIPDLKDLFDEIELGNVVRPLLDTITNLVASVILVVIYVIFLLLERNTFKIKLRKMFETHARYEAFSRVMRQVNDSIRTYITVKVFTSFLTGLLSFLVMTFFGLDFALFWAFLIFLLNFIPSIGSITATSLPLLFSLLQFDSLSTFFLLLILLIGVQILVGNYIDPLLMGSQLNISPLVILFSLVAWGSIWGFAGMIFSVPIMAVIIIGLGQFSQTRPIAVLLSSKGDIDVKVLGNSQKLEEGG